ncbi:MAG: Rpn family recombination-promoting nuclease/putative transposase [Lachnospiraceae bacterium]|nr:Rpn family recombination-promoting nuclease/putative transposase [Lachnospiraceae bacterium]
MEQLQKQYQELTFIDDFMFGKVLVNNPEICRRLLEVLLEIRIKKISFPERQKAIEILSDGKGIRLDVYVDDENGTIYNIEMQTKVKKELPKRSRYYQGMIDMNLIERGAKYKELKLSFVIFICLKDPFGYGLPVYRFENICVQNRDILLKDEAIKVFINADGDLNGLPEDLAAFLQYLKGNVVENELVQRIDNEVEKARKYEEWRVEYMTSYLRDMDIREEGIEIGMEQGLEQGLAALVNTIKGFTTNAEDIYQAVIKNEAYKDTPREEVLKYLN